MTKKQASDLAYCLGYVVASQPGMVRNPDEIKEELDNLHEEAES